MQEGPNARQQIVERIRQSTSILVAVGANPSVDALAAALGLALMLNKLNKHATAVFSGQIPPAIQFLEPAKTFESNVDALRDFIISLDKEKADRLRYKVEDDVVRIFITPYKTSITEKDLQYSQGDFNVDLILAVGVEKRDDLDKAIVSHGRILHDATVVTLNTGNHHSSLGALDWSDSAASSLCEMLVSLSEALQQPGILDAQTSTALLTGIVAATDRFSNKNTSPRVMTMAAQLMAAGANQQLIATNLEQAHAIATKPQAGPVAKQQASTEAAPIQEETKKEPGELDITHETKPAKEKTEQPEKLPVPAAPTPQQQIKAEAELDAALPSTQVTHDLLPDLQKDLEEAVRKAESGEPEAPGGHSVNSGAQEREAKPEEKEDYLSSHGSWKGKRLEPPTLGGTLSATTEEAREDAEKAEEDDRNKTLLNHPGQGQPSRKKSRAEKEEKAREVNQTEPTLPIGVAPVVAEPPAPLAEPPILPDLAAIPASAPPAPVAEEVPPLIMPPEPALPEPEPQPTAVEPDLDALHNEAKAAAQAASSIQLPPSVDTERQAVAAAIDQQPFNPANQPLEAVGAQQMPAMPDMPVAEPLTPEALQALPPAPAPAAPPMPNDLPPLPPMPPMPSSDMALPPAPAAEISPAVGLPPAPNLPGIHEPVPPAAPPSNDPGQFKIPGA